VEESVRQDEYTFGIGTFNVHFNEVYRLYLYIYISIYLYLPSRTCTCQVFCLYTCTRLYLTLSIYLSIYLSIHPLAGCPLAHHVNGGSWWSSLALCPITAIHSGNTRCTIAPWQTTFSRKALHKNTQTLKLYYGTQAHLLTVLPGIPSSPGPPGSPCSTPSSQ